jgi:peptide/nickel transport system permease protein
VRTGKGILWVLRLASEPLSYVAKTPLGVISLLFFSIVILMAVFPSHISPYDPYKIDADNVFKPPSVVHLFGTDDLGRDVMSQVIYGARTSMTIAAMAVLVSTILGTFLGLIAGYYGGRTDIAVSMAIDAKLSIPTFFLVLVVIAIFGGTITNMILVIGITIWPPIARVVRAAVHSIRSHDFVEAARALGASSSWIISRHILPQVVGVIVSISILQMGSAVIIEAGLSFLGLGDPTVISWGRMLSIAQTYIEKAWWMGLFPGLFLFLTILSLNIIGDRLYEFYNPKLREKLTYIKARSG